MIFLEFIAAVTAYILVTLVGWYRWGHYHLGDFGMALFLSLIFTSILLLSNKSKTNES